MQASRIESHQENAPLIICRKSARNPKQGSNEDFGDLALSMTHVKERTSDQVTDGSIVASLFVAAVNPNPQDGPMPASEIVSPKNDLRRSITEGDSVMSFGELAPALVAEEIPATGKNILFTSKVEFQSPTVSHEPQHGSGGKVDSLTASLAKPPADGKKEGSAVSDLVGQDRQSVKPIAKFGDAVAVQSPSPELEAAPGPPAPKATSEVASTELESADVASQPTKISVTLDLPEMGTVHVQVSNQGSIRARIVTDSEHAFQAIAAALPVDSPTTIDSGIPTSEFSLEGGDSRNDASQNDETAEGHFDQLSQHENGQRHGGREVSPNRRTLLAASHGNSIGKLNVLV